MKPGASVDNRSRKWRYASIEGDEQYVWLQYLSGTALTPDEMNWGQYHSLHGINRRRKSGHHYRRSSVHNRFIKTNHNGQPNQLHRESVTRSNLAANQKIFNW